MTWSQMCAVHRCGPAESDQLLYIFMQLYGETNRICVFLRDSLFVYYYN